ncbi:hypothetical protein SLEP1_g36503 [Rubroshorea leprosula]|uniref:GTD-binding domain-containing protein n=1 Tax=Rubroshorea leprosula TaxID=152421 RepID=A0AAV5KRV3_9ROSI|nr:hypothetical protein SLEP1_g36503 [Rubroshorea leprosula]
MADGGISFVYSQKISCGLGRALASAALEWLLIFMLFVDAIFSYLITKFAVCYKLQTPCLLCSRLDHVLGNKKLKFYWDLICGHHKLEISSLVYCHAHNKLVDVHEICESCFFSFATTNKSNAETYRLLVGKLGEHSDCGLDKNPLHDGHNLEHSSLRHCSCCNETWLPKVYTENLLQMKSVASKAAEVPSAASLGSKQDEHKEREDPSISARAISCSKSEPDPLSHIGYSELKISSNTESEISDDDESSALIHETNDLKEDIAVQYVQRESQIITLSDSFASDKLINPASALQAPLVVPELQQDFIDSLGGTLIGSTTTIGDDLGELNWQQTSDKTNPSTVPELICLHDVSKLLNVEDTPETVSTYGRFASLEDVPTLPNTSVTPIQFQVSKDTQVHDDVPPSSIDSETPLEESKEDKLISEVDLPPSFISIEASNQVGNMSTAEIEDVILMESEKTSKAKHGQVTNNQLPLETNNVASDSSNQTPSLLELGDAYKLAVGSRGRQLSGAYAEHLLGKDSSRLGEDLRILLSQLSTARSIEQSINDMSPRVSVNTDELKASDSSTLSGMQMLQKMASLERNESGLSLDGSIVSEIEGESVVDRLKRQVEHDRKLLNALYKELEEERNASAVAANQAMAMITRLQEEKATLHLEAFHNLRMMEEQAEYDMEALQNTNDLLAEKEKEIQDLEAELEFYQKKFPNESMLEDSAETAFSLKAREKVGGHTEVNLIEESSGFPINSVSENPSLCHSFDETNMSCMKNSGNISSLLEFENERLNILNCLKQLEKKVYQFPNNGLYLNSVNGECSVNEGDEFTDSDDHEQKAGSRVTCGIEGSLMQNDVCAEINSHAHVNISSLQGTQGDIDSSRENPPVLCKGGDIASLAVEISNLNEKLEALKTDLDFLEHAISSVRKGHEGLKFIEMIASNLQELRRIVTRNKDQAIA